ncbi:hypothetical protein [Rhodococcoides fascians]|uniref:hypothetical protein n=1 Tax=Rhodococcoides fascians TaxID=1828 RepID=UPI000AA3BA19|nr:hypothetical protein [Rhodococcus fascians]
MVLEIDFANPFIYGIDLEACLDTRSWRWFRLRLIALLGNPASKLKNVLTQEV